MYSTSEAARKLGLSQDHVRLLARSGVLKSKKLGHDWIVLSLDYQRKRKAKVSRKVLSKTVKQNVRSWRS